MIRKLWFWYGKRHGLFNTEGGIVHAWDSNKYPICSCRFVGMTVITRPTGPLVFNRQLTDAELKVLEEASIGENSPYWSSNLR